MNCQALFSLKNNTDKNRLSSATILLDTFRVEDNYNQGKAGGIQNDF